MTSEASHRLYGEKVGEALAYAAEVHSCQMRKGKIEPYLSHVLRVSGLVAHYGGDEEQIIAGVLHDAAEDQGGEERLADIARRFGPKVERLVRRLSDSLAPTGAEKAPWRERKEEYLAHLTDDDPDGSHLVAACDKLANLQDIVEDLQALGPEGVFGRFKGGADGTRWFYGQLGELLIPQVPQMVGEYQRLLSLLLADEEDAR